MARLLTLMETLFMGLTQLAKTWYQCWASANRINQLTQKEQLRDARRLHKAFHWPLMNSSKMKLQTYTESSRSLSICLIVLTTGCCVSESTRMKRVLSCWVPSSVMDFLLPSSQISSQLKRHFNFTWDLKDYVFKRYLLVHLRDATMWDLRIVPTSLIKSLSGNLS